MKHLKRLAAPKSWPIQRKGTTKFIAKQNPGPHKLEDSMPIVLVIRELLGLAKTRRETIRLLAESKITINSIVRKDLHFPVGLMDIITVKPTDENYIMLLNKRGKLFLQKIPKSECRNYCKIIRKTALPRNRLQLNLSNGWNLIADSQAHKSYKVGDTLIISQNKIVKHLKFDKGATVYLTAGKHSGSAGTIQDVIHLTNQRDRVSIKSGNETFETLKDYAFVIEKPFTETERSEK